MYQPNGPINKTPPDPKNLLPGDVVEHGRKSNKDGKQQKSLKDQHACCDEVCVQYSLPATDEDWWQEAEGCKGDWPWEGRRAGNGLEEADDKQPTRPVLTKILKAIITGKKKCLVVWSQDRLWRNVSLCQDMLDILYRYDCLLYDYNGPVNIWTIEGRNAVLNNAITAQTLRERAATDCPRGVRRSLAQGKPVISTNVQGFRSAGKRTCKVTPMLEELEIVRRVFAMADVGEGNGPMTNQQIADTLMAEGLTLYHETGGANPHGNRRVAGHEHRIYCDSIGDILKDVRYIGLQTWNGDRYPCPAFLIAGEPVIALDLFERMEARIKSRKRTSNRAVNNRPLASLVRDAVTGIALSAQVVTQKTGEKVGYWIMRRATKFGRVQHRVPTVREDTLTDYIYDVFAPLILADIAERQKAHAGLQTEGERVRLEKALEKAERHHREVVPTFARQEGITPMMLMQIEQDAIAEKQRLRREIEEVAKRESKIAKAAPVLQDLRNAPEAAVRDALRACIVWVAVLPAPSQRVQKRQYRSVKYSYAPAIVGKMCFLTSWGMYHTAVICRDRDGLHRGGAQHVLRPAEMEHVVGGVADFPDPEAFVQEMMDAWSGKEYDWSPDVIAPGYHATAVQPRIFDLTQPDQDKAA